MNASQLARIVDHLAIARGQRDAPGAFRPQGWSRQLEGTGGSFGADGDARILGSRRDSLGAERDRRRDSASGAQGQGGAVMHDRLMRHLVIGLAIVAAIYAAQLVLKLH